MTLPLALRVRLQPDEPPAYFASRLAVRNFRPAKVLCARDRAGGSPRYVTRRVALALQIEIGAA
jgi:hypothetical protein